MIWRRTRLDILEERIDALEKENRELRTNALLRGVGYPDPRWPMSNACRTLPVSEAVWLIMNHLGITFDHVMKDERMEVKEVEK